MTNSDMINKVRSIITLVASDNRMEPVFPTETLEGLGIDSLDRHTIALEIEERFNIDIEDGVPEAWTTIQDVIDSVSNELGYATGGKIKPTKELIGEIPSGESIVPISRPPTINEQHGKLHMNAAYPPLVHNSTIVYYNAKRAERITADGRAVINHITRAAANELNMTLSEIALANLEKLCDRTERDALRGSGDER